MLFDDSRGNAHRSDLGRDRNNDHAPGPQRGILCNARTWYHLASDTQKAALADRDIPGKPALRTDMSRLSDVAIVIDRGARVDDREVIDGTLGIHHGAGTHR